jgi:hypothetical protein
VNLEASPEAAVFARGQVVCEVRRRRASGQQGRPAVLLVQTVKNFFTGHSIPRRLSFAAPFRGSSSKTRQVLPIQLPRAGAADYNGAEFRCF